MEAWAGELAAALGVGGAQPAENIKEVAAIARDLQAHKGASMVVAGNNQPPHVHALAHAMNQALGNVGKTVTYTDPIEGNPVDQQTVVAGTGGRHERRQGRFAADSRRQSGLHRARGSEFRRPR